MFEIDQRIDGIYSGTAIAALRWRCMTDEARLKSHDIAEKRTSLPSADHSRIVDWGERLDIKSDRLRAGRDDPEVRHDPLAIEPALRRRLVVLWCVLLATLYAVAIWIICTAV